ncbi:hypothetical protein [Streptomyces sp. 11-1-2]|uniref:hypothetical protein n=1 Tax=unclassified Streptomyces TaxID=2593676 RepID=UPI0013C4D8B2|nr:hypothetical protein [Streptomyces sp. 11-1-2]
MAAVSLVGFAAGPASAAEHVIGCTKDYDNWQCEGSYHQVDNGPNYLWTSGWRGNLDGPSVSATFQPSGEILEVFDRFNNDHKAVAYLWIDGEKQKPYFSNDPNGKTWNLHFAEGLEVMLQVCTSKYDNAVCTKRVTRTT